MDPGLLLKDKRKLVYRHGVPGRRLRRIRESDVLRAGDAQRLAIPLSADEDENLTEITSDQETDFGSDFSYRDDNGLEAAVELKLPSRDPPPASIRTAFAQLRHAASKSPERFHRAEVWVLSRNASTLTIWSDRDPAGVSSIYGLADVVSTESAFRSPRQSPVDSAYIQQRVESWRALVRALYEDITDWLEGTDYRTDQASTVRMDEELMQRFAVDPVELPVLRILKAGTVLATVRPIGLWVIGSNGRIDILTAKANATIVNTGRDLIGPDWRVYLSRTQTPQPFERDFLLTFLRANEGT